MLAATLVVASATSGLVPKPRNETRSGQIFSLADNFTFAASGTGAAPGTASAALLEAAFKRYSALLFRSGHRNTGASLADQRSVDWLLASSVISVEEHAAISARVRHHHHHPLAVVATATRSPAITGADVEVHLDDSIKTLKTDESYILTVAAPRVKIRAATVYGAIYALESLAQLVDYDAAPGQITGTTIVDSPRFAFRATMVRARAGGWGEGNRHGASILTVGLACAVCAPARSVRR